MINFDSGSTSFQIYDCFRILLHYFFFKDNFNISEESFSIQWRPRQSENRQLGGSPDPLDHFFPGRPFAI
jgi:hypothetical protein